MRTTILNQWKGKKRKAAAFALFLAAVGMLAACGQSGGTRKSAAVKESQSEAAQTTAVETAAQSEGTEEKGSVSLENEEARIHIAAVAAEVGIPYFTTMQWGAMDAAKDHNVELYWTGPAEWDFGKQQTFIDGVMSTNPDALMLVPTDNAALVAYVDDWMEQGIPVICTDLILAEHVDLVGYSSDPYSGGAEAAKQFYLQNGEGGVYLPVGTNPGAYGANLRVQGFVETIKELDATCKVLDTVYPGNDANKAAQLVSAAVTGNPDLTGVFVATSAPASGAASAIIEAGKNGVIKVAAFDADPQQVLDLKAGTYDVLIAQDPYQMGYDAITNLAKHCRGELTKEDFKEAAVYYEMKALTRENVDDDTNAKFRYIAELSDVGY